MAFEVVLASAMVLGSPKTLAVRFRPEDLRDPVMWGMRRRIWVDCGRAEMMIVEGGMFSFPIPSPNSPEVFSATSLSFRTRFLFTPLLVGVTRLVGDGCALAIANGEGSELLVGAPAGGSAGTPAGGSAGAPAGGSATLLAGELWGVVVGVGGIEVAGLECSDQRAGSMSDCQTQGMGGRW